MEWGSVSRESKDRCAGSGTFRSWLCRRGPGNPNAKDHPVDSKRAGSAQQHGEGRTEAAGFETRQMRPACLEMNGTFRLRHPALKTQAAHDAPECARAFFRAVRLQVFAREGESCVADAKRSPASSANCGQRAELYEPALRAADGIKAGIRIHGSAPWVCAALPAGVLLRLPISLAKKISQRAGSGRRLGTGRSRAGWEEKGIRGDGEARRGRSLRTFASSPWYRPAQLIR